VEILKKDLNRLTVTSVDRVKNCSEPFAKELLKLWYDRNLKGQVIIYEKSDRILGFTLVEIQKDEVDTVIEVPTASSSSFVVNHYGSGTLVAVTFDTTRSTLSRGDLPS